MNAELINADFSQRVVIAAYEMPWSPSPQPGVERRPLDRVGGEVARATTIVRYAPESSFSAHEHALGEEFLVLDGVFSDEHGDYPKGTYVRNPPGSRHTPRTGPGCIIFVKLRQMSPDETQRIVIDTNRTAWRAGRSEGHARMELFSASDGEEVTLERIGAGGKLAPRENAAGEEILVVEGNLRDETGTYAAGTWIRNPPFYRQGMGSTHGALCWVKRGHLRELARQMKHDTAEPTLRHG
jgi:anti-sigma factor ChrR (cupin superfamily)